MSSIRDQIPTDDLKSETVVVPEWNDMKLTVRELSLKDRNAYQNSLVKMVEDADGDFHMVPVESDPLRQARLVIASTYDENGDRAFEDGDAEFLGARAPSAVDRLSTVAVRLSGLNPSSVSDAGKDSESTEPAATSSD